MSISKFREFVEKSGCGWVVAVVVSAIMLFGILQCGGSGMTGGPSAVEAGKDAIAVVGSTPMTTTYVNNFSDRVRQQELDQRIEQKMDTAFTLEDEVRLEGHSIEQSMVAGLLLVLCEREGIKLDAQTIGAALEKMARQSWAQQKTMWITEGKLKPTATDADFEALFQKEYKQSTKEILERNAKDLPAALEGPQAFEIKASYANQLLIEHFGKTIPSAEADVAQMFDTFNTKRIVLQKAKHPGEDLVAKLNQVKKEIQSGAITFEAAMNKYSDEEAYKDPKDPSKNKTKADNQMIIDGLTIQIDDSFAPVAKLKKGELSEPLGFANSVELYRLDSTSSEKPADFKANFDQYRQRFVEPRAVTKMQDALTALKTDPKAIDWRSEGYHVLYDRQVFMGDVKNFAMEPAARRKKLEEFLDRAQKAMEADEIGGRIATFVAYAAMEDIYNATEPKDRAPLEQRRQDLLKKIAETTADAGVSLKLANTLAEKKDKDGLVTAVEQALDNLMSALNPTGQRLTAELQTNVDKWLKSGLITDDQAKGFKLRLDEWKKAKIENDKFEAEAKKAQEEQDKLDKAAQKAQEEADKKAAAEASKAEGKTNGKAKELPKAGEQPEKAKSGG